MLYQLVHDLIRRDAAVPQLVVLHFRFLLVNEIAEVLRNLGLKQVLVSRRAQNELEQVRK